MRSVTEKSETSRRVGKSSHRDRAYGVIRRSILLGHLQSGMRVNERVLAEKLGISRVPVREALLCLHGEGLIRKSKRGLQVVKLTPEETAYQMEFRAIVECAAVRLVAERITPVEIERLREVVVEQEVLLNSQDFQALYESDLHFHQLLLKASRNPFIYRLSAALGMSFSAANATVSSVAIRTHASLLDAVGTGDADGAEKLMYEHIIGKAAS